MAQQIDIVANLLMKVDGAEAGINKIKNSLSKLKLPEGLENSFKKSFGNLDTLFAKYKSQVEKGFETKGDVSAFSKTSKALDAELTRLSKHFTELTGKEVNFRVKSDEIVRAEKELQNLIIRKEQLAKNSLSFKIDGGENSVQTIGSLLQKLKEVAGATKTGAHAGNALDFLKAGDIKSAVGELDRAAVSCKRLKEAKQEAFKDTGFDMGTAIAKIIAMLDGAEGEFGDVNTKITEVKNNLANFQADQIQKAGDFTEDLSNKMESSASTIRQADGAMQDFARSSQSMSQQLGDLQQSTQYFFSLRNMINLFKRGIDDAIQSVKQLDAAMTETAVVTDYKVSDMWNMLPQYTKLANQLGATTQGAYETMTLYFQQGLNQQQAFELGEETMKMARIAGLDYAETTDMMTAALRGFNMELDKTSAKRINDVYSELAAITASDTEELGTAMQRTASIAHSAGMSFEGTTAFLAQAIETTREPAENIGTAMKTIIARFQEMKENPLEIAEVDGEEVSYNKVDKALQSIGVSLKDTNGQFRELDRVFLDISQRWDGLTQTQQRYIATTAAGSRQQSRFIAMMDNYDRTVQLVDAANNSAGASNAQFEKTMDSLESKLNKLHNAWQQFTMGIANNGMIKGAVDGITDLLSVTNKLIDTFSLGISPLKSFLSIFTAFAGLKAVGKVANAAIGGLGSLVDPQTSFKQGLFGGGISGMRQTANATQASMIYSPIVNELRSIRSAMPTKGDVVQNASNRQVNPYQQYERFKTAKSNIAQLTKAGNEYSANEYIQQFDGISAQQQQILRNGSTISAYKVDAALLNRYSKNGINLANIRTVQSNFRNEAKAGTIAWKEYYRKISDPEAIKQGLKAAPNVSNATMEWVDGMAKETTSQAKANIAKAMESKLYNEGAFDAVTNPQQYQEILSEAAEKKWQEMSAEQQSAARAKAFKDQYENDAPLKNNFAQKALEGFGKLGAGISSAGIGIQTFGSLLSSSANPALQTFGAALTSMGSVLMGFGGLVSGISTGFTAVAESSFMTSIATNVLGVAEESAAAASMAITGVFGVLAAAIGVTVFAIKKHNDNIRKAAEDITTNYQDKNEKAQTNIDNLQSWKADFARLSAGVDANGNNINLSTDDYDRYLEITKGIAEINPSIVEGYNAQGRAIITNNKALEETLKLEKEHQAEAFNTYTSLESTETLKRALDLSRKERRGESNPYAGQGESHQGKLLGGYEFAPQTTMRKNAQRIGSILQAGIRSGWASEDLLKDFEIDIAKLAEGDSVTLAKFDQLGPQIQQRISNSMDAAGDKVKDSVKNSMADAFSGYSEASDELDELVTPMYEHLLAKMSKESARVPDELRGAFNEGIKAIVSDANVEDYDKASQDLLSTFTDLGTEYDKINQKIEAAQDKYAQDLKKNDYKKAAEEATTELEDLRDNILSEHGLDKDTGAGKAIDEFFTNEIEKINNLGQTAADSIEHALNTMKDQIAAAEGVLETYNAVAEGSTYGKAASNMSQIYESATADEHIVGEGDQAFWAGAEALIGRKSLLENGEVTKDSALEQMKRVQEMLKGGQEGWDAFKIAWFNTADANFKVLEDGSRRLLDENGKIIEGLTLDDNNWFSEIDEKVNPEVYDQIADALDMSKESLVAMLNLGRQFGEVDFTNIQDVRKGLALSDNTIKNADNGKVFVKEETLDNLMTQEGIDLNKQQQIKEDLHNDQNVDWIKPVEELTKSNQQFTDMGIKNMDSLIKTFNDTGEFTKDEIQAYAEKWSEFNGEKFNLEDFNEKWEANQSDEQFGGIPSSLNNIESILSNIASILASQRLEEGYLDNPTAQASKDWLLGGKGQDTEAQYFWKGQGTNGEAISTSDFQKTSSDLTDFINKSKEYVNQLSNTDPANETEREQINKEIADYESLISRAETYLAEGTEAYNSNLQKQIKGIAEDKEVVNNGFADLFDSITPESINTDGAQQALRQLYEAAINNAPIELDNSAASQNLVSQLQNWGITLEQAVAAGLVFDPNHLYTKGEELGEKEGKAPADGIESGIDKADTSQGKGKAEQKVKEAVEGAGEEVASGAESANIDTTAGQQAAASAIKEGIGAVINAANAAVPQAGSPETSGAPTETKQQLSVTYDAQITNSGEMLASINQQIDRIFQSASSQKREVTASGSVKVNYAKGTQAKASNQNAKVNYLKGTQAKPEAMEAKVNYTLGSQASPSSKSASVNYSIGSQELPKDKTAYVTYKRSPNSDGPHTGGYITSNGVLYRAKGGRVEHPGYPKKGTDTIPAYLTPGEYVQNRKAVQYFGIDFMRHINHKDLAGALQSFGSAAKGRYGRLGPDGKGGLTLTGEKGFEVAWIPSENRSMVLGVNGPQMANLPSDTIIWDHRQSKKILAQNAIPAGSHYVKSRGATRPTSSSGSSRSGTKKNNRSDNNNNNNNNNKNKGTGSTQDASNVAAISNIIVWWDNITRRADKTQRKADKNQKDYEKYLKNIQATLTKTGTEGKGNDFISNINKAKGLYQEQFDRAKTELKNLDKGTKAQRNARKTKSKKDDKTARRKAFNAEAGGAVQISYETGKGSKKKTKNALINTAGYIQAKDGTYIINQTKLNKVTKKGGKRKALAEALNKEINDRISKKNTAEDNIRKAREALEQFSKTLYETFFAWESELTQIWSITKKIEQAQNRSSRADKYLDLLESQLSAGLEKATSSFNQATISAYQKQLTGQVDTLKAQVSAISANQKAVQKAYSTSDEKTTRDSIQKRLNSNAKIEAAATKKNDAKKKLNAAKADKKKQQAEIKKQNKIINDKNATKAQKAAAKKALAKANKQLEKDRKNITKYQKQYNTANKNYKNVASSNTALSATEKAGYQEYVKELNNQINIAKQAQKYLKPTQYADGTMDVEFNSDAFEADKLAGKISKDMAEGIDKYVTGITEAVDELNKAYEDLTSSLTELYKSLEDLRSEYADNADELVKVLDEQNQKELDKLKELNDSLTKALKDLLDEVKKRLDERRRQEDNAKTERDISQKQQRLAMLRADTAGGNQVEIAQLEKEIAEAQQNYQRSLEDQLLDRLQEQGDEAAKQRERQIELQEMLVQGVNNIPLVESWLSELKTLGHTEEDEARRKELEALMRDAYRSANDYENQGSWRQNIIDTQFQSLFNSLDTFDEKETATVNAINNTKTAIETVTTSIDNLRTTIDRNNNSPKTPSTPASTKPVTPATSAKSATSAKLVTNNNKSTSTGMGAGGGALSGSGGFLQDYNNLLYRRGNKTKTTDKYWGKIGKDALKAQINRGKKLGYSEFKVLQDLANTEALDWGEVLTAYINLKGKTNAAKSIISYFGKSPSDARKKGWKNAFGKNYPKYEYGGLADFTGPAWLDGTQSKPELVLNSTDTKNFLALKDVLSHALSSTSSINNSYGGDATFEININVDHINNDYDVDKIAERVKRNIVKDSSYRNVTQVRKFR